MPVSNEPLTAEEYDRLLTQRYEAGRGPDADLIPYTEDFAVGIPEPQNYIQSIDVGGWFYVTFGLDGLSLTLIRLTAFITPLTILYCWHNVATRHAMALYRLLLEFRLIVAFWTRDLVRFFILFELIRWPMYRLIVV